MAKKPEPPKPIFPLKHEFYASLDNFIHQAGMLSDIARQMLQMPDMIKNEAMRKILQDRLDTFAKARHGEDQ